MTRRGAGKRTRDPNDIGLYLGFFGVGPWVLFGIYVPVISYQALVLGGPSSRTPLSLGALALVFGATTLIASPSSTPLPLWRTLTLLAVTTAVTLMVTLQQPFHDRPPVYVAWDLGANQLIVYCLAIRGRIAAAWAGELLMIGAVSVWSTVVTGSPLYGLSFSYGQPITLIACTAFAVGLHRTARQIVRHRASERERADQEAKEIDFDLATQVELRVIRQLAETTLVDIAEERNPDLGTVRGLEAAVRDLIRGRMLAVEPLVTALRVARERGADVVLLDDLTDDVEIDEQTRSRLAQWIAVRVLALNGRSATVRVSTSKGTPLVTISIDGQHAEEYDASSLVF